MPLWFWAGFWGLLAGSALLVGAAAGCFSRIPQRQETRDFAGLITVAGFLIAFALSKLGG